MTVQVAPDKNKGRHWLVEINGPIDVRHLVLVQVHLKWTSHKKQ